MKAELTTEANVSRNAGIQIRQHAPWLTNLLLACSAKGSCYIGWSLHGGQIWLEVALLLPNLELIVLHIYCIKKGHL
jgi:hypothetical protein